ncbi:MAG: transglutaminase domain-containing protein [Methanomicrobiaceae archaeon]|nr:transglutaminase domain-containing protein [Methanomicrobiaceae archaeon]
MTIQQRFSKAIKKSCRSKKERLFSVVLEVIFLSALVSGIVQAGQTESWALSPTEDIDNQGTKRYNPEAATIEEVAKSLMVTVQSRTVVNIENFVRHNFDYEFHWHPQRTYKTWETKTGDCTDRSLLIVKMLEENGFEDVKTAHGYVYDEDGKKVKHDWVEVTIRVDGTGTFDKYEKVGDGIW